jgi:hypothetical protein
MSKRKSSLEQQVERKPIIGSSDFDEIIEEDALFVL